MSKKKSKRKNVSCENCANCLPIGEGNHFCDECMELVIVEYEPSDAYLACHGESFAER